MKTNNPINYLRESATKIQQSTEFRGLANFFYQLFDKHTGAVTG